MAGGMKYPSCRVRTEVSALLREQKPGLEKEYSLDTHLLKVWSVHCFCFRWMYVAFFAPGWSYLTLWKSILKKKKIKKNPINSSLWFCEAQVRTSSCLVSTSVSNSVRLICKAHFTECIGVHSTEPHSTDLLQAECIRKILINKYFICFLINVFPSFLNPSKFHFFATCCPRLLWHKFWLINSFLQ